MHAGESIVIIKPMSRKPHHEGRGSLVVIRPDDSPPEIRQQPDIEAVPVKPYGLVEIWPEYDTPPGTPQCERSRPGVSGCDIIKAIIYGGLFEIITSLGVLSSAAGGDATTLNIVSLGLANVLGGLVILFQNLWTLKKEHVTERYQEQLGRPGHFPLHATVAIISYLVFGLMPPLIYGFSFNESNDKNSKLMTLAAASLVCITVLSIGKAHVRRPPKGYGKTIFYYLNIGIMVPGLGYVAGQLTSELLKRLNVFEPESPVTMATILEAGAMNKSWSSYGFIVNGNSYLLSLCRFNKTYTT